MSETLPSPDELRAAQLWQPPVLRNPSSAVASDPVLHTAAQLDALETAAYQEGFARGQADGYSAGFAAGLQQAREEAQRLRGLLEHLTRPLAQLDAAVERQLVGLCIDIGQRLVQDSLHIAPEQVAKVVQSTLAALEGGAREVRVLAHPDDVQLIEQHLRPTPELETWRVLADSSLARGDCRVLSEAGNIDARLSTRVAVLSEQLIGEGA